MLRKLPLTLIIFCSITLCLAGQKDDLLSLKSKQWISVASLPQITLAAGQKSTIPLKFQIGEGYHINSHTPKSDLLIPTALIFKPVNELTVGTIEYPKGKDLPLTFDPDEKVNVYTGEVSVNIPIQVSAHTKPGTYSIHAEIRYQACNDRSCFPPRSYPLDLTVTVR